jgi:hypothetical protein
MSDRVYRRMGWGYVAKPKDFKEVVNKNADLEVSLSDYVKFVEAEQRKASESGVSKLMLGALGGLETNVDSAAKRKAYDLVLLDKASNGNWMLLITPAAVADEWTRYDDALVYAELQQQYLKNPTMDPMATTVDRLTFAQHPFNGIYMNSDTGKVIDGYNKQDMEFYAERKNSLVEGAEERICKQYGLTSFKDLKKVVPYVPDKVKHVAEWLNLFHESDSWKLLRPMIITGWR